MIDKTSAARAGYELQLEHGIYVVRVDKNGPAAQVNIQQGDVILKINDKTVNSLADLRAVLDNVPIGSRLAIVILRNGQQMTANPVVVEMPN